MPRYPSPVAPPGTERVVRRLMVAYKGRDQCVPACKVPRTSPSMRFGLGGLGLLWCLWCLPPAAAAAAPMKRCLGVGAMLASLLHASGLRPEACSRQGMARGGELFVVDARKVSQLHQSR